MLPRKLTHLNLQARNIATRWADGASFRAGPPGANLTTTD